MQPVMLPCEILPPPTNIRRIVTAAAAKTATLTSLQGIHAGGSGTTLGGLCGGLAVGTSIFIPLGCVVVIGLGYYWFGPSRILATIRVSRPDGDGSYCFEAFDVRFSFDLKDNNIILKDNNKDNWWIEVKYSDNKDIIEMIVGHQS